MIADLKTDSAPANAHPTVWGLTPTELHDRFWAARGVQVVRVGEPSEIVEDAELFLLMAPRLLANFALGPLVEELSWLKPDALWVRIQDQRESGYHERAVTDEAGRFVAFERDYGGADSRLGRVVLTPNSEIARIWQSASDAIAGWRELRRRVTRRRRTAMAITGKTYDRDSPDEVMDFVRQLVTVWKRPDATVERAVYHQAGTWADPDAGLTDRVRFVGPVWVGAGRLLEPDASVVGPAVLWDDPEQRPTTDRVRWNELEPHQALETPLRQPLSSSMNRLTKRAFDIAFALAALLMVLPLFPLIMLAIWLEDGRPFFFAHMRETLGGREFPCLKFRSMRNDAEQIKAQLAAVNQVDGPQFFMENDPRVTKVGRFLRKTHLDELPQLLNVLVGQMSVVGPRPSPHAENQYCPAWREARLSIRPGITGLWQVMRTRREGEDFQEWIRYDLEYVENASMTLDMKIIIKTVMIILFPNK
ncbi:sugar transferase [Phycisphaerales bacterium AB-hyl4]|uniref:Sugar transferase n=1 Tax=Natronomicrosphaera hydrolytica TaxID=3242702 RepID=A0ABV4U4E4_9BACT